MTLPADHTAFLLECANGNQDAAGFLLDIATAARMADDLADSAQPIGEGAVGDLVATCLITIPARPFFRDNFSLLAPVLNEMIVSWQISGEFKKSDDVKKQTFGYVYREATDRVAVAVALLTGGSAHSRNVMRKLYDTCHAPHTETVEQWVKDEPAETPETQPVEQEAA